MRVPPGCLFVQAGKQMEWLTAGSVLAGFHEVVVTEETLSAVHRAREAGRPLWRVSSTLFTHVASDKVSIRRRFNPLGVPAVRHPPPLCSDSGSEIPLRSQQVLRPLGRFAEEEGQAARYPPTKAGVQVQQELQAIRLKRSEAKEASSGPVAEGRKAAAATLTQKDTRCVASDQDSKGL